MVETGDIRVDKIMPHLFKSWVTLPFEECLENKSAKFKKLKKKEIESKGKYPVIDQGEKLLNNDLKFRVMSYDDNHLHTLAEAIVQVIEKDKK